MKPLFVAFALACLGCAGPQTNAPAAATSPTGKSVTSRPPVNTSKTAARPSEARFVAGPPLDPSGPLLAWLQRQTDPQATRKTIRLPVVFERGGPLNSFRLGYGKLGLTIETARLAVSIDDTALGIGLASRLQRLAPKAASVAVWLEGVWGPLIEAPSPRTDGAHVFAVRSLVGRVDPARDAPNAQVIAPPR